MSEDTQEEAPKPLRRVRIQNDDGIGYNTKITDADTGQSVEHIYHARVIEVDAQDRVKAMLWGHVHGLDVVADAEIVNRCPLCGSQKPEERKLDDRFRVKLTVDDTDIDLSIDKLKELQHLQRSTRGNDIYPAEALTAFIAWLREKRTGTFLAPMSGNRLSELAQLFCKAQGWRFDQEYYDEVSKGIEANYPE